MPQQQSGWPIILLENRLVNGCVSVLLYRPPVGLVSVVVVWQWCSRHLKQQQQQPQDSSVATTAAATTLSTMKLPRAYRLDTQDQDYAVYGGILRVRRQVLLSAMEHVLATSGTKADDKQVQLQILLALREALQVSFTTAQDRQAAIQQAQYPLCQYGGQSLQIETNNNNSLLLRTPYWTARVRTVDALVRLCRDRLLQTAFRLQRLVQHAQTRVERRHGSPLWGSWHSYHGTLEARRRHLAHLQAALQGEVKRLGQIAAVLATRPDDDWDESVLLSPLRRGESMSDSTTSRSTQLPEWLVKLGQQMGLPEISSLSSWKDAFLESNQATGNGAEAVRLVQTLGTDWNEKARVWTNQAMNVLFTVIEQSLIQSYPSSLFSMDEFVQLQQQWKSNNSDHNGPLPSWTAQKRLLEYVDSLPTWRRLGEGPVQWNWQNAVDLLHKLDWYGIPSSLLTMAGAYVMQVAMAPYWPDIQTQALAAWTKSIDIAKERFWEPVKGIWDDLMNKDKGIFSAFGLDVEESSLDHLLRDLGFGDGTPSTRHAALQKAAEQYENDVRSSMVVHTLQGRLPRLMLVQVQQLKVGMLSALDNIDVLLKGNRIHFQLLATIPAILMASYGTRLFVRFLFNVRSRNLRSVASVHHDMEEHLNAAERLLLQASEEEADTEKQTVSGPSDQIRGELLLLVHCYLVLMEYTRGVFSKRRCTEIHTLLHHVVEAMNAHRGISWLRLAQQKHKELFR